MEKFSADNVYVFLCGTIKYQNKGQNMLFMRLVALKQERLKVINKGALSILKAFKKFLSY